MVGLGSSWVGRGSRKSELKEIVGSASLVIVTGVLHIIQKKLDILRARHGVTVPGHFDAWLCAVAAL